MRDVVAGEEIGQGFHIIIDRAGCVYRVGRAAVFDDRGEHGTHRVGLHVEVGIVHRESELEIQIRAAFFAMHGEDGSTACVEFSFESDFGIMKTVLGNLFSNSVKYHNIHQADPFIRVVYRIANGKVQLSVEDNGQGIQSVSLDKIFDMFYRASASSDGTGLGLYIVKESLTKLNATVFVKSFHGTGSTFTIQLPQPR